MQYRACITIQYELDVEATNVDDAEDKAVKKLLTDMSDASDVVTIVDATIQTKKQAH